MERPEGNKKKRKKEKERQKERKKKRASEFGRQIDKRRERNTNG